MGNYFQCLPVMMFKNKTNAERFKNKLVRKGFNALVFKHQSLYYVHICNYLNEQTKEALIKNLEFYGFNIMK
jgi:hypothetical protein